MVAAGTHPIFDATGSALAPGRWNSPGSPMIHMSEHHSTAPLEMLVHGSGRLPPNQHYVQVAIPRGAEANCDLDVDIMRPGVSFEIARPAASRTAISSGWQRYRPRPHRSGRPSPSWRLPHPSLPAGRTPSRSQRQDREGQPPRRARQDWLAIAAQPRERATARPRVQPRAEP